MGKGSLLKGADLNMKQEIISRNTQRIILEAERKGFQLIGFSGANSTIGHRYNPSDH